MGWKHIAYHIIDSDPGHTRSKQQLDKNFKITFTRPSKNTAEKENKNNTGKYKALCAWSENTEN